MRAGPQGADARAVRRAARLGRVDIVRGLLAAGVQPHTRKAKTLVGACSYGHVDTVRALLQVPVPDRCLSGFRRALEAVLTQATAAEGPQCLALLEALLQHLPASAQAVETWECLLMRAAACDVADLVLPTLAAHCGRARTGFRRNLMLRVCHGNHKSILAALLAVQGEAEDAYDASCLWGLLHMCGSVATTKLVLATGARIGFPCPVNSNIVQAAVARAATHGDIPLLRALMEEPSLRGEEPFTDCVLHFLGANVDAVEWMLRDPRVNPAASNSACLQLAARRGYTAVVQLLLRDGRADPAAEWNGALRASVRNNLVDIVMELLKDPRVDPVACGHVLLSNAAQFGCKAALKVLLHDGRVDPAVDDGAVVQVAALYGHVKVLRLLLADKRMGAVVHACGHKAIIKAIQRGHALVVDELLSDPRIDPTAARGALGTAVAVIGAHGDRMLTRLLEIPRLDPDAYDRLAVRCALATDNRHALRLFAIARAWRRRVPWIRAATTGVS
jgi:hypothetical protein